MSSEKDAKYVYAQEHKLYYYYHFGGHWLKKRREMTTKQSEGFVFYWLCITENVKKHLNGYSIFIGCFRLYEYLILTFRWFILLRENFVPQCPPKWWYTVLKILMFLLSCLKELHCVLKAFSLNWVCITSWWSEVHNFTFNNNCLMELSFNNIDYQCRQNVLFGHNLSPYEWCSTVF